MSYISILLEVRVIWSGVLVVLYVLYMLNNLDLIQGQGHGVITVSPLPGLFICEGAGNPLISENVALRILIQSECSLIWTKESLVTTADRSPFHRAV